MSMETPMGIRSLLRKQSVPRHVPRVSHQRNTTPPGLLPPGLYPGVHGGKYKSAMDHFRRQEEQNHNSIA
eukprot:1161832-Pelagomonas_calceolata.AAC.2